MVISGELYALGSRLMLPGLTLAALGTFCEHQTPVRCRRSLSRTASFRKGLNESCLDVSLAGNMSD